MIGWTVTGREIELSPMQEKVVRGVLAWGAYGNPFPLPRVGRQGGKTTMMATIAEYHRRGYLVSPSEALHDRLKSSGDVVRRRLLTDVVFHAEVATVGKVLDLIGATAEQVDAVFTALSMPESPIIPWMKAQEPGQEAIDDVKSVLPPMPDGWPSTGQFGGAEGWALHLMHCREDRCSIGCGCHCHARTTVTA